MPLPRTVVALLALVALSAQACVGEPASSADAADSTASDTGAALDTAADSAASDTGGALDTAQEPDTHAPDTDRPDFAIEGGSIAIHVAGDHTPKAFADGLSGQTPRKYVIALSRYEVLTELDDPNPVVCFDHGDNLVEADMSGDTLVGTCATVGIPTATYTYGRVKVEWATFTVDGWLHAGSTSIPGAFTFFRAYSDTTYGGENFPAGEGWISFADNRGPLANDPFPVLPGLAIDIVDGEFLMTFPFNRPLPVVADDPADHSATFHWEVFEGFRWEDLADVNYVQGQWDVSPMDTTATEKVVMPGVTGYHITTSLD